MIKLLRVDDRLIHGQVAVSWTSYLSADTILVANDNAITDKLIQMAFQMAKPPQVTLSIKSLDGAVAVMNNPKHAGRAIFVVTASIQDALYLMERCEAVKDICLGGIRKTPGKKMVERQVYLDDRDMEKEIYLQAVPTEKKLQYGDIVKEFKK